MEKKIELEDENILKLRNNNGELMIDKGYLQNGEPSKILTMFMSDDFGFEAYTFFNEKTDSIDFSIPNYDPLYKHFNNLLDSDNELVIKDDLEDEEAPKHLKIQRQENNILVNFYNGIKKASLTDKFSFRIINISFDGRSIIDRKGLDTKERLIKFFRSIENELLLDKKREDEEK